MQRVLVTGGCGFIGTHLVADLLRKGFAVRILDDLSSGSREDLAAAAPFAEVTAGTRTQAPVELVVGDVRDRETVAAVLGDCEAAVHLAAQTAVVPSLENPLLDADVNVRGTVTLLDACRRAGVARFVFASSNAALGGPPQPPEQGLSPRPLSPYGAGKLAGEGYCSAFNASFGMLTVSLRFANAYGPRSRRKASVVAAFCRAAIEGLPLFIHGDGGQTRDFIHVRDLCRAVLKALASPAGGEVFPIATGTETTILELAERIRALAEPDLGRPVPLEHRPSRGGEFQRTGSATGKAARALGFAPAIGLDEGLPETWAWFRSYYRPA